MKSIPLVLFEAVIVAISLLATFYLVEWIYSKVSLSQMTKSPLVDLLLVTGFLIHIIFEYTGINRWYSIEYCKLVKPEIRI